MDGLLRTDYSFVFSHSLCILAKTMRSDWMPDLGNAFSQSIMQILTFYVIPLDDRDISSTSTFKSRALRRIWKWLKIWDLIG